MMVKEYLLIPYYTPYLYDLCELCEKPSWEFCELCESLVGGVSGG